MEQIQKGFQEIQTDRTTLCMRWNACTHGCSFLAPTGRKMPTVPRDDNKESGKIYPNNPLELTACSGCTPACRVKVDSHMMDGTVWVEVLPWMSTQIPGGTNPDNKFSLIADGHASQRVLQAVQYVSWDAQR
eukprot:366572-Chlamydomonas_euryale.AAC.13